MKLDSIWGFDENVFFEDYRCLLIIEAMQEAIRSGGKLPPSRVFGYGGRRYVMNGNHGAIAYSLSGKNFEFEDISCSPFDLDEYEHCLLDQIRFVDFNENNWDHFSRLRDAISYLEIDVALDFCSKNKLDFNVYYGNAL